MRTDYKTGGKSIKAIIIAFTILTLALCCFGITGCSYCAHDLQVKDEKVASTCVEHGHSYTYECKKCKKLFAYTLEKGLYEVDAAEQLPLSSEHTMPEIDEENIDAFSLGIRLKDGKTSAESVFDYEVTSKCSLCEEEFAVNEKNLVSVVPSHQRLNDTTGSRLTYTGTRIQDEATERWYTSVKLGTTTRPTDITELDPYNASSGDPDWIPGVHQRLPIYIPFNKDQTRYVVYIVHNTDADTTIELQWSIDGKNYGTVTVAPGEYKPLILNGKKTWDCNVDKQFMKVKNTARDDRLGKNVTIEMTGYIYTSSAVEKLDIDSQPTKIEYAVGEEFDPAGLKVYATYTDYALGKSLKSYDYNIDVAGRPLTEKDDRVTVSYGGKKVSLHITVKKEGA